MHEKALEEKPRPSKSVLPLDKRRFVFEADKTIAFGGNHSTVAQDVQSAINRACF